MGSRYSPSRHSSFSYANTPSRRSSLTSNPDIFSDDYALEHMDSRINPSLHDTRQSEHTEGQHDERDDPNITSYPAVPQRLSMRNRPNSISKRPVAGDSLSVSNDGGFTRTLSTSSRISTARSPSPYSGPTQPSHPYAMYPQVTRASSIASVSTIRPQERPFVPTGGPEHPYSLYPQNTVSEEDDNDIGTQPIPLGFPRLGLNYPRSIGASGSDVGDIVGRDGHIEHLPPYTRYADNVVAKGDMADINSSSVSAPSRHSSEQTTLVAEASTSERLDMDESSEREVLTSGEIKKETWKEKAHRRVCGGIALWLLILIIVMIVFAGVVGGLIGGLIGRRQGSDLALQSSAATTTIWLDADPVSTGTGTPSCPTGRYKIPLQQAEEIHDCIVDIDYSVTWGCLDFAPLGIEIADGATPDGNVSQYISFDDYSTSPWQFYYGPQPPDFNGTRFQLKPFNDRDDAALGVALFFAEVFDKLLILPGDGLNPAPNKRSVDMRDIIKRSQNWDAQPLQIGDQPWYCFWNATISEFWIFLEEPANASVASTAASVTTPPTPTSANTGSGSSGMSIVTPNPSMFADTTGWNNYNMPSPTPASKAKRDRFTSAILPLYPKLVKMIEKRRPEDNTQPYCQRMQVLNDWQIVPTEDNQIIFINESDYSTSPASAGSRKRSMKDLRVRDTTSQLKSNCVCEWMSV